MNIDDLMKELENIRKTTSVVALEYFEIIYREYSPVSNSYIIKKLEYRKSSYESKN